MAKHGKKYTTAREKVNSEENYDPRSAVELVKETAFADFDETIEVHLRMGLDPRQADQQLRDLVVLPHGLGKTVRVLVFAQGEGAKIAEEAGADYVGFDEYIEKIKGGWADIDVVIATPDGMGDIGKLGKILGPRGLMPNPKSGTVTMDVAKAVNEVKAGRMEFRVDKYGILHVNIGKASFEENKLKENFKAFLETIIRMKPTSAKGQYIRSVSLSSTMGPGIKLDRNLVLAEMR